MEFTEPGTILRIVTVVITFIAIVTWFRCKCYVKEKHWHYLLRKLDILERGDNDTDREPQSTLHGYVVPRKCLPMLVLSVLLILYIMVSTFLDFLFSRKLEDTCDAELAMYSIHKSVEFPPAILYKTTITQFNTQHFVCYKYQLNITSNLKAFQIVSYRWLS